LAFFGDRLGFALADGIGATMNRFEQSSINANRFTSLKALSSAENNEKKRLYQISRRTQPIPFADINDWRFTAESRAKDRPR
jgi:hypothetical protein